MAKVKQETKAAPKVVNIPPQFIEKAKQLRALMAEAAADAAVAAESKSKVRQAQLDLAKDMQRAGLKNFNVDGVGPVYVATEYHPKVLDKVAAEAFLKADKEGKKLFKLTVNAKTANAFYVERFKNKGKLPPTSVVDVASYVEAVARIRSEKEGSEE